MRQREIKTERTTKEQRGVPLLMKRTNHQNIKSEITIRSEERPSAIIEVDGHGGDGEYDLETDEHDDDNLEPLIVAARDLVFEQLQHVLQHLDSSIEQVDALWNFEVGARCRVKWLEVGLGPEDLW